MQVPKLVRQRRWLPSSGDSAGTPWVAVAAALLLHFALPHAHVLTFGNPSSSILAWGVAILLHLLYNVCFRLVLFRFRRSSSILTWSGECWMTFSKMSFSIFIEFFLHPTRGGDPGVTFSRISFLLLHFFTVAKTRAVGNHPFLDRTCDDDGGV